MSNTEKLILNLKEIVGEANVIQDREKLKEYTVDGKTPGTIVFPGSVDESSKILVLAHMEKLTVLARGSGTKMAMGGIPEGEIDVVISSERLNTIKDCDTGNLTLSVESGLTLGKVQEILAKEGRGYFLPLDPPFTEAATLGGIVATNDSGPTRYIYGTARDLVLGLKFVTPSGEIVVSGGKVVKNVTGYDMNKLHIGALGTLGFICEVTCRLLPLPEASATLLILFKDLGSAGSFIRRIVNSSYIPAFIELFDALSLSKISDAVTLPASGGYVAAVGLEGVSEAVERQIFDVGSLGNDHKSTGVVTLRESEHLSFSKALRDCSLSLKNNFPNLIVVKSNFVISRFTEMIEKSEAIAKDEGVDIANICHAGNGILYSYLLVGDQLGSRIDDIAKMIEKLRAEAATFSGGSVIESAPTLLKEKVSVWGEVRNDYAVMRSLKDTIDPEGIFCPGRYVGNI